VTLADYSLSPDVAIVDPQFVMSMPRKLTADTGIDCLTHGAGAGVSIHSSPIPTPTPCRRFAWRSSYLPVAFEHPRTKRPQHEHNAACIAALAIFDASWASITPLAMPSAPASASRTGGPTPSCCRTFWAITRPCPRSHAVAEPTRLCGA